MPRYKINMIEDDRHRSPSTKYIHRQYIAKKRKDQPSVFQAREHEQSRARQHLKYSNKYKH